MSDRSDGLILVLGYFAGILMMQGEGLFASIFLGLFLVFFV